MTVPLADRLKSRAHPQTLHQKLVRGAVTERLVQALMVVEFEVGGDAVARLRHVVVGLEVDFYLRLRHSRSTKMLSAKRPRPSMLIATPWPRSTPVKPASVNWLPWSVLKISGRPWRSASSKASMQKLASSRLDKRHANT